MISSIISFRIPLTLAELRFRNSLSDNAAGVVHHGGGLKLHGLHDVSHANL